MKQENEKTPVTKKPTPPETWSARRLPVVAPLVAGTGEQQRKLEDILAAVKESVAESRLIRISGQEACQTALKAFDKMPIIEKRVNRLGALVLGTTLVNLALLVLACAR